MQCLQVLVVLAVPTGTLKRKVQVGLVTADLIMIS